MNPADSRTSPSRRLGRSLLVASALLCALSASASLNEQLTERREAGRAKMDDDTLATMDGATERLAQSGIVEQVKKVSSVAVDFTLPNHEGRPVNLFTELKKGPVVLIFYRGGWCPYCNMTLHAFQEIKEEVETLGAQMIAISPEPPDRALSTAEKNELGFQVLSDANNETARDYGLVFPLDAELVELYQKFGIPLIEKKDHPGTYELPLAATYIIDRDRIVIWKFAHADYTKRAEPADVLAILKDPPKYEPYLD